MGVETDQQILDMFGDDVRITATIEKDSCKTREDSLLEIYRRLRRASPLRWRTRRLIWTPCFLMPAAMM